MHEKTLSHWTVSVSVRFLLCACIPCDHHIDKIWTKTLCRVFSSPSVIYTIPGQIWMFWFLVLPKSKITVMYKENVKAIMKEHFTDHLKLWQKCQDKYVRSQGIYFEISWLIFYIILNCWILFRQITYNLSHEQSVWPLTREKNQNGNYKFEISESIRYRHLTTREVF